MLLDNDFALEVLTLNGLLPPPLAQSIHAYRGLKMNIAGDDITSWFKYGHRAFSIGESQKILGYYVNEPWNNINGRWEFGGTYVSLDPKMAASFAGGITTNLQAESILIEMLLPKGTPKVCGAWKHEYELVPISISGSDIIAVYKLEASEGGKKFMVYEALYNPYISNTTGTYKSGDEIQTSQAQIAIYDDLGCKELPASAKTTKSSLYQSYDDFILRYAPQYQEANALLVDYYFSDRPIFENSPLAGCDPEIACC